VLAGRDWGLVTWSCHWCSWKFVSYEKPASDKQGNIKVTVYLLVCSEGHCP